MEERIDLTVLIFTRYIVCNAVIAIVNPSVHPFVRLSVCLSNA